MLEPKGLASASACSKLLGIQDWRWRSSPSLAHAGLTAEGKERWCSHEWLLSLLLRNGSILIILFQSIPQVGASSDLQIHSMMQWKAHGKGSGDQWLKIVTWPRWLKLCRWSPYPQPTPFIHLSGVWLAVRQQIWEQTRLDNSSCYVCPSLNNWNPFALS